MAADLCRRRGEERYDRAKQCGGEEPSEEMWRLERERPFGHGSCRFNLPANR
jgi:hypothetical protein